MAATTKRRPANRTIKRPRRRHAGPSTNNPVDPCSLMEFSMLRRVAAAVGYRVNNEQDHERVKTAWRRIDAASAGHQACLVAGVLNRLVPDLLIADLLATVFPIEPADVGDGEWLPVAERLKEATARSLVAAMRNFGPLNARIALDATDEAKRAVVEERFKEAVHDLALRWRALAVRRAMAKIAGEVKLDVPERLLDRFHENWAAAVANFLNADEIELYEQRAERLRCVEEHKLRYVWPRLAPPWFAAERGEAALLGRWGNSGVWRDLRRKSRRLDAPTKTSLARLLHENHRIGHDVIDGWFDGEPIKRDGHFRVLATVLAEDGQYDSWLDLELRFENAARVVASAFAAQTSREFVLLRAQHAWAGVQQDVDHEWLSMRAHWAPEVRLHFGFSTLLTLFLGGAFHSRLRKLGLDEMWILTG